MVMHIEMPQNYTSPLPLWASSPKEKPAYVKINVMSFTFM